MPASPRVAPAHGPAPPQLAPDDAWRCPHCKQLQQGSITLSLWTLPDVLIIHLKRFRQVRKPRPQGRVPGPGSPAVSSASSVFAVTPCSFQRRREHSLTL